MRAHALFAIAVAAVACTSGAGDHAAEMDTQSGKCATCHLPDYERAPHHVGERPATCAVCHAQTAWKPQHLVHKWELTGKHADTKCFDCHTGASPKFEGTTKECYGCHQKDYERAPEHVGHFPKTCEKCHGTTVFKPELPNADFSTVASNIERAKQEALADAGLLHDAGADATADAGEADASKPKPKVVPVPPRPHPTTPPTTPPTKPDVTTHPSPRR